MGKCYMTPQDVADILGVKQNTARGIIKANMEYIRIGNGRILVSVEEFEDWQKKASHKKGEGYVRGR